MGVQESILLEHDKSMDKERDLNVPWHSNKSLALKIELVSKLVGNSIPHAWDAILLTIWKGPEKRAWNFLKEIWGKCE